MSVKVYSERAERFRVLQERQPQPGDVLLGLYGKGAEVVVQNRNGVVTMWTTAVIDDGATGWYLSLATYGLKVMIDPRCHQQVFDAATSSKLYVKSLRIVRASLSGTSLIGEVVE